MNNTYPVTKRASSYRLRKGQTRASLVKVVGIAATLSATLVTVALLIILPRTGAPDRTVEFVSWAGDARLSYDGKLITFIDKTDITRQSLKLLDIGSKTSSTLSAKDNGCTAFSHDGSTVAFTEHDLAIHLWNIRASRRKIKIDYRDTPLKQLNALEFSPDDRRLAAVGYGAIAEQGVAVVFDVLRQQPPLVLQGHNAPTKALAFFPDGRALATAGEDGAIHLWDLKSSKPFHTFYPSATILSLAVSPKCDLLAAGDMYGRCRVWNLKSFELAAELKSSDRFLECARFSKDGRWLATLDGWHSVQLWSATSWKEAGSGSSGIGMDDVRFIDGDRTLISVGWGPVSYFSVEKLVGNYVERPDQPAQTDSTSLRAMMRKRVKEIELDRQVFELKDAKAPPAISKLQPPQIRGKCVIWSLGDSDFDRLHQDLPKQLRLTESDRSDKACTIFIITGSSTVVGTYSVSNQPALASQTDVLIGYWPRGELRRGFSFSDAPPEKRLVTRQASTGNTDHKVIEWIKGLPRTQ
jgi:hypothetical protein